MPKKLEGKAKSMAIKQVFFTKALIMRGIDRQTIKEILHTHMSAPVGSSLHDSIKAQNDVIRANKERRLKAIKERAELAKKHGRINL